MRPFITSAFLLLSLQDSIASELRRIRKVGPNAALWGKNEQTNSFLRDLVENEIGGVGSFSMSFSMVSGNNDSSSPPGEFTDAPVVSTDSPTLPPTRAPTSTPTATAAPISVGDVPSPASSATVQPTAGNDATLVTNDNNPTTPSIAGVETGTRSSRALTTSLLVVGSVAAVSACAAFLGVQAYKRRAAQSSAPLPA